MDTNGDRKRKCNNKQFIRVNDVKRVKNISYSKNCIPLKETKSSLNIIHYTIPSPPPPTIHNNVNEKCEALIVNRGKLCQGHRIPNKGTCNHTMIIDEFSRNYGTREDIIQSLFDFLHENLNQHQQYDMMRLVGSDMNMRKQG